MDRTTSSTVPVPDPTLLTTAALKQSIDNLEKFLIARIESGDRLIDEKISHNHLMDEKRHRETLEWIKTLKEHRLEAKGDRDKALTAAFDAQKELFNQQRQYTEESTTKAEQSFTKQIESLDKETKLSTGALSDRMNALKAFWDKQEGERTIKMESGQRQGWVIPMFVVGGISALSLVIQVIRLVTHQ